MSMGKVLLMTPRQQQCAVALALVLLVYVVNLVRTRRLREDYAWLWIATSLVALAVPLCPGALRYITWLTGAVLPSTVVFLGAILMLIAICVHL